MTVAVRSTGGVQSTVERLIAQDDTERTLVGIGVNTVMSRVSGISIPVGTPVRVTCEIRRDAGAAFLPTLGFRINATIVHSTAIALAIFTAAATAQSGMLEITFCAGDAGYLQCGKIHSVTAATGYGTVVLLTTAGLAQSADIPLVPITSLAILGNGINAGTTIWTHRMKVYA